MPKRTPKGKKSKQQVDNLAESFSSLEIESRIHLTRAQRKRLKELEMDRQALPGPNGNDARGGQQPIRRLRDYITPDATGYQSAIAAPGIEANNFEIKHGLIQMVSGNPFGGGVNEDPNQHLQRFIEICNTSKMNGISQDAYYLRVFPFSLTDKARRWLDSHPRNTFTTWEALAKAFLNQYFPPSKTIHYRQKIANFRAMDGETLYEAWERYKDLMRMCPHHNFDKLMIVHTFYTGVPQSIRSQLDQAAGGAFADMDIDEGYDLIEKTAQNAHLWSSERTVPRERKGSQDLYAVGGSSDPYSMLASKVDSLSAKLDSLKVVAPVANMTQVPSEVYCHTCGSPSHFADACPIYVAESQGPTQEDANFIGRNQGNSFAPGSASNPYYHPSNRQHPNFSYKNQSARPPGFSVPQQGPQYGNRFGCAESATQLRG